MNFTICIVFHTRFQFDFDFSKPSPFARNGWVFDLDVPFLNISFGTGIIRER